MAKITEPMTMITDYILTVECLVFSIFLLNKGGIVPILMGIALSIQSVAAFTGGSVHGLREYMGEQLEDITWRTSMATLPIGAFFMIWASFEAFVVNFKDPLVIAFAVVNLAATYYLAVVDPSFFKVILIYVPQLILIAILSGMNLDLNGSLQLLTGVLLTLLGGIIQVTTKKIMPSWFNNNDLFHVIQMAGIWYFFLGALQF